MWVDSMGLLEEGESGERARGFVQELSKGECWWGVKWVARAAWGGGTAMVNWLELKRRIES